MHARELDRVCERRCWGTLLSEPFCVSNLLTQFGRSGVRSRVFHVFSMPCSWVPLWSPSSCTPPWTLVGKQYHFLPPLPPPVPLLFLVLLSFILSSVCLHLSALASFSNVLWLCCIKKKKSVSMVMSKDNHNQGSIMEEIWGGRIWDRRADRRDMSMCLWWGDWVNCRGRRPRSNLRPECCIKAYSQGCVSSTVTSLYKEQGRILTWNLIPGAWGGEQFLQCTWTPFYLILWRCVFMCCIVCHIESDTAAVHAVDCLENDLFTCSYIFLREWADRVCVCVFFTLCDTKLRLINWNVALLSP